MLKTEAIYRNGVLNPTTQLDLPDEQRVRITIELIVQRHPEERRADLEQLLERMRNSGFRSNGSLPTRDELNERR